ncbi:L-type lectin family protein [Levilactobacillus mulengensis]|mgnify:CR=1 FL=1|uniref:lectin-like domain-containing protein n=1 Tax=Levilactobacillus mulengensis TaxID=2486025 RepID=UPI000F7A517F|nr:hypothetical protein [Levilactobacillus mulengensis]
MKVKAVVLGILTVGTLLGLQTMPGLASTKENVTAALGTAPQGIAIDSYFERGTIANNSAKISDTDHGKNQAVQLTDATNGGNELGTIWTSDAAAMDLGEDQTASMWLYTGDSFTSSGDGMTFVMQNDDRGTGASAINTSDEANPTPATGETLGVWGDDINEKYKNAADLAATGIQNSWALEFDTYANKSLPSTNSDDSAADQKKTWDSYFANSANSANQFDLNENSMHIASAYPGDKSSYDLSGQNLTVTTYGGFLNLTPTNTTYNYPYAVLNHQGVITNGFSLLGTGTWKHLTLKWDASRSQMTYTFDDKDPDTGAAKTGLSQTVTVDKNKLNLGSDNKIRWGFTGSTGSNFENNLVVFEQVPGLVSASATAKLTDSTQSDKEITSASDTVNAGDRMNLKYNLNYNGGRDSWQDIQAKLNLPSNIVFNNATITYANGDTQTVTDLDTQSSTGQALSEALSKELSSDNDGATILLNGKAVAGDSSETTVAATNNNFNGSNAITQASLTGFKVEKNDDATVSMTLTGEGVNSDNTTASKRLTKAADVAVTGKISYVTGTADPNSSLTLHPVLNGKERQTQTLSNSDAAGAFTYTIPGSALVAGQDNVLTLYATDSKGHATNDVSETVNLSAGSRSLVASPKSSFNSDDPQSMSGSEMTLTPDSNWDVTVDDTEGTGDQWTLTASATPFISKLRGSLSADMTYVTSDGTSSSLMSGAVDVLSHTTTSDDDVVNITNGWNDSQGLFLNVHSDALEGTYFSTITWTLGDTPT